ncbi:tail protein X [Billgrantia gudaonensis]|uniref:P2-like prophage tail protein X n=1 Tax=Billgrantia gudaonensis TaxID=376427 RepID=A0A1G9DWJ7_9GAMM|nr:tail protein X [Halomonas gudaonensis]SDK68252.1 P2-like prophage tail protein X [Halomonas gudaonensis]
MPEARAHQGETLDRLCHRVLGRTAGVTERALAMNPGLAELGPVLPQGTLVTLPDAPADEPAIADTIQLWT